MHAGSCMAQLHHGTVMVKVRVAVSEPVKTPTPLALETNRPKKRVIELRSAAEFVICTGVVVIWVNGPPLALESSSCNTVGWAKLVLRVTLMVAVVELKSANTGLSR